MDPIMMLVIAAIVAAIVLVEFNKQQKAKVNDNSHINFDIQQAYLLKAAEYKIEVIEDHQKHGNGTNTIALQRLEQELAQLTKAFEKGDIQLKEFNLRLDTLLNNLDPEKISLAQAS
ncbi:hypothetical protein MTO98_10015 [Mucilaginibacter sp. SMC90]|uniref:hypothetical protein n=1 Tax=Mucilaginibacter sp. SMC90 TaxID=2929803 RepID=UPI001FB39CAC|nr:hypothetical protein [Mucilaginibacter sp. SMC90]UOE51411.1 hypothetical protein MTO98_10015 [Mucilaginibacter sp. SMC90]